MHQPTLPLTDLPTSVDLLIVGLGPAGIACLLQARRDGLKVLAFGDEPIGGLVRAARRIDNLPGMTGIAGAALAERFADDLARSGAGWAVGRVSETALSGGGYQVTLADGRALFARALCLATGTRPRAWALGDTLQGLHRDARTLPAALRGRAVIVVGGGEAALDTALSCRDRGAAVRVLARGARLASAPVLVSEAEGAGVEILPRQAVAAVTGGVGRWQVTAGNGNRLVADELVICIGREPCEELGRSLADEARGVFRAGDLIRGRERYVATAMGDGQRAALAARDYLGGRR